MWCVEVSGIKRARLDSRMCRRLGDGEKPVVADERGGFITFGIRGCAAVLHIWSHVLPIQIICFASTTVSYKLNNTRIDHQSQISESRP